jgi:DNA-directed RNA polymerase subunit RPC12/RpoP
MSERKKQFAVAAVVALAIVAGVYAYMAREGSIDTLSQHRNLMDIDSGEVNAVPFTTGMAYPYKNPKTGKNTLYPFEICYHGECGKIGGTRVILEEQLSRPGPTHCPKCGYRVVLHNPGIQPPASESADSVPQRER